MNRKAAGIPDGRSLQAVRRDRAKIFRCRRPAARGGEAGWKGALISGRIFIMGLIPGKARRISGEGFGTGALICRSLALSGILFQFRLLAGELSDGAVFVWAILGGLFAGAFCGIKKTKPLPALIVIALLPFAVRLLFSLPRFFAGSSLNVIITLDSLLLDYDRNNFVSMLPFYYAAVTTFFCASAVRLTGSAAGNTYREDTSLPFRACVFPDCLLLTVIFSTVRSFSIPLYSLPVVRFIVFGIFLFLELSALILSAPEKFLVRRKEKGFAFLLLVLLTLAGAVLLLFRTQNSIFSEGGKSGGEGSGLLQPKLFNFDLTPFLNLQSEVSMNDDLVFIVQRDDINDTDHIYMRRFVLSDYNSRSTGNKAAGFTRSEKIDGQTQRSEVPEGELVLKTGNYKSRKKLTQEYYIVNIDGAALLAMNEPERIIPYENYDASSFKSVYSVESSVSTVTGEELFAAAEEYKGQPDLGLSTEDFNYYTAYANAKDGITETEQKIKELAESVTSDCDNYFEKIAVIARYFSEGEFRYSLKPGVAADGDQLRHFLFVSKRGYCSYFAFAAASMLRSLNIPCRVVVGFYLDTETEKLGFYPVLSNMAHAWVEVWFPEYGWLEFDVTTDKVAEDEEFSLSGGVSPELFEKLMKEIIDNHKKLVPKQAVTEEESESFRESVTKIIENVKKYSLPAVIAIIVLIVLLYRFKWYLMSAASANIRIKTIMLWKDILLRLSLKKIKKKSGQSEGDWVNSTAPRLKNVTGVNLLAMYGIMLAAKFGETFTMEDYNKFISAYKEFSKHCRFPGRIMFALFAFAIFLFRADGVIAQEEPDRSRRELQTEDKFKGANALYREALRAADAQYWEHAVDLLNEGKQYYPGDTRFPLMLGGIYFEKEFYNLAKDEFVIVRNAEPDNLYVLRRLAEITGRLNENLESSKYLEQYLELAKNDINITGDLGWMYFKLHKLEEGRDLLLKAISKSGPHPRNEMILATIYKDMLNYKESKYWYENSALVSQNRNMFSFASIVYYNYSILESRYFNYQSSFELSEKSVAFAPEGDSGYMACGELYLRRLDFNRALQEYEKAYRLDKRSPLPKLALAETFLIEGRTEEALAYTKDCAKLTNHSWMLNFGIDPGQYKEQLNRLLHNIYKGLLNQERLKANGTINDIFKSLIKQIRYKFKSTVHKLLYKKYSLLTARSYSIESGGGQYLDALHEYYNSFEDYSGRAMTYLDLACSYETERIPGSVPLYLFERGRQTGNKALIEEAISLFDSGWENDIAADSYLELYNITKKQRRKTDAFDAAEQLYLMNPGAMRQSFVRLPVTFNIDADGSVDKGTVNKIKKHLKAAGFEDAASYDRRFVLSIDLTNAGSTKDNIRCVLIDKQRGMEIVRHSGYIPDKSGASLAAFANGLSESVFKAR